MNRRDFLGSLGAGVAIGRGWPRRGGAPSPCLVERWSWAMGQPVHLQLYHASEAAAHEAAALALAELRRVEARLSRFDDASDLAELNRRAGRGPMRAGPDLLAVLAAAERFRRSSGGAFNPAVEPLMRAWGFREPRKAPPGARELSEARAAVRACEVRISGDRAALPARHTALDLGGIGVGYALDRAGAVLRARGVTAALLDVSGDLLAIGAPPGETGWAVGITDPATPGGLLATLSLRDQALATSANTVATVRLGARVAGHVLDPDRGVPADRVRQATAACGSALAADALSTGMLVAGRLLPGVERGWIA